MKKPKGSEMALDKNGNIIHPTALIGNKVRLGTGNFIGPHCIFEGEVEIGDHNHFEAAVITHHKVKIGNNCRFYPYVTLGFPGEMGAKGDKLPKGAGVEIADNVTFREYVNVHAPYWWESTFIGKASYIMNKAYIAHDVQLGEGVIINAGVCLGGRAQIHDFANIGMSATVHQRSAVGESAMVGMNAVIKKEILPFCVVAGVPARILKFNRIGAERRGLGSEELNTIEEEFIKTVTNPGNSSHIVALKMKSFLETYPDALRTFA